MTSGMAFSNKIEMSFVLFQPKPKDKTKNNNSKLK